MVRSRQHNAWTSAATTMRKTDLLRSQARSSTMQRARARLADDVATIAAAALFHTRLCRLRLSARFLGWRDGIGIS
jgi:hypothetical protein